MAPKPGFVLDVLTCISGENELYAEGTKVNPIKSYVSNLVVFVPTLDVVGLS